MTSPAKPARDTRLLDKSTFDEPDEFLEAGSTTEADMIAEWDRDELVDTIQQLDQKCFDLELRLALAEEALGFYADEKNWYLEIDPTTHSEFRKTIDLKDTDHFGYQASPESKNILQVIAGKTARDYFDSVKKEEGK